MLHSARNLYTTKDVVKEVGISRLTLYRWLAAGKVSEVSKDYKNHRIFTKKSIDEIKRFKAHTDQPGQKKTNHAKTWSQRFLALPGAWQDDRTAEDLIDEIYAKRRDETVRDVDLS